jgi:hypothetical protein
MKCRHRDYRLYLDDILQAIDRIMLYVQGVDLTGFNADTKTDKGTPIKSGDLTLIHGLKTGLNNKLNLDRCH